MGRSIPVVIGFLANQVGLRGLGARIGEMVGRAHEMVDQGLTWLVNKAVTMGRRLLDRVMGRRGEAGQDGSDSLQNAIREVDQEGAQKSADGELIRADAEQIKSNVNRDHPTVIEITRINDGGSTWDFEYVQRAVKKIPKKKTIPRSEIRDRLYELGAYKGDYGISWDTARKNAKNQQLPKLRDCLAEIFQQDDETAERTLVNRHILTSRSQHRSRSGKFSNIALNYLSRVDRRKTLATRVNDYFNKEKYVVDHVRPIAEHWTKSGFNTGDKARWNHTTNPENLELITKSANSILGAIGEDGNTYDYSKPQGANFNTEN
jgi:hypothetical protein